MRGNTVGLRRSIRYVVVGTVLLVSFYYVARKLGGGVGAVSPFRLSVDYRLLALSIILALLSQLLGGWRWSFLLKGFGAQVRTREALRLYFLSIPPKYIPGFFWQYLGQAYLCRQAQIPMSTAALTIGSELALVILAVPAVVALSLPYAGFPADSPTLAPVLGTPLPLIGVAYVLATPLAFQKTLGSSIVGRITGARYDLSYSRALFLFLLAASNWGLFGLASYFLATSFYSVPGSYIGSFVFTTTVAIGIGLVAFVAPMGLGVREGVMTFLLSFWLPAPYPALMAVLTRLLMVMAELIGFATATKL